LSDCNWREFAQPIFAHDQIEALDRFFFFDKQAYAEAEHERKSDCNNKVCQFFGTFQPRLMAVKARRFQVFEQGFDLEAAFVVVASFATQFQVCQQKKRL